MPVLSNQTHNSPVLIRRRRLTSNGTLTEIEEIPSRVLGASVTESVRYGNIKDLKEYLETKRDVNARDKMGNSLLHLAVEYGQTEITEILLYESECDVDCINNFRQTPLILATILDDVEIVKKLTKAGADLNIQDMTGKSALLLALQNSNYDIADYLIKHGSDVNVVDRLGQSALYTTINTLNKNCIKIAKRLLTAEYSIGKDKEWMKGEGLDIEMVQDGSFITKLVRKISGSLQSIQKHKSLLSHLSIRSACDGARPLHVMKFYK